LRPSATNWRNSNAREIQFWKEQRELFWEIHDAESWLPVQHWLLRLRRSGKAVIIVHHAGKGRAQRGTSRREPQRTRLLARFKMIETAAFERDKQAEHRQQAERQQKAREAEIAQRKAAGWQKWSDQ